MIHRIEITQQSDRAESGSGNQLWPVLPGSRPETLTLPKQNDSGDQHSDHIPEKALLHGGDVPRQTDKHIIASKEKGRQQNKQNPFVLGLQLHTTTRFPFGTTSYSEPLSLVYYNLPIGKLQFRKTTFYLSE